MLSKNYSYLKLGSLQYIKDLQSNHSGLDLDFSLSEKHFLEMCLSCQCVCVYGGNLEQGPVNRINRRFGRFKVCVG